MSDKYSPETKAAVMSALMAGQALTKVAEEWNIPEGTIRSWKSRQYNGESVAIVATEKKEEVGELLVSYLQANLDTLRKQSEFFGDKEWLQKQDASAVAVLHGVVADKTIRLLEAMNAASDTDTES